MLGKVAARIERERMLPPSGTVGVAVSGGADSVALLRALRALHESRRFAILHVNHGWRGAESDEDERFVRRVAEELDCQFLVRRISTDQAGTESTRNQEQRGRQWRYEFFRAAIADGTCCVVATGHTQSDQAETVLFRLLRGATGSGLSGIWPVREARIVRPLLDVTRAEVLEYLNRGGIAWREDSTNQDRTFARSRLRHDLLPALRNEWNPNIAAILANVADWAVEEERFWQQRTAELVKLHVREEGGGLTLDTAVACVLSPAEQRRLVAFMLRHPAVGARAVGFGHIEAIRGLLLAPTGSGGVDVPGARAERSCGSILIRGREIPAAQQFDCTLPVPGCVALPTDRNAYVRARLLSPAEEVAYNKTRCALLDWDLVSRPLRLRNWRPGDRYCPVGKSSAKKITDLFQRGRVPAWRRTAWPVVTCSDPTGTDRILWARSFGPARDVVARPGACRLLAVDEFRESSAV